MGKRPHRNPETTGMPIPAMLHRLGLDRAQAASLLRLSVEDLAAFEDETRDVSVEAVAYLTALYLMVLGAEPELACLHRGKA